jgi:hypothetical protein
MFGWRRWLDKFRLPHLMLGRAIASFQKASSKLKPVEVGDYHYDGPWGVAQMHPSRSRFAVVCGRPFLVLSQFLHKFLDFLTHFV